MSCFLPDARKANTPWKTSLHQSLCTKPSENRQTLSSGCPGTEVVVGQLWWRVHEREYLRALSLLEPCKENWMIGFYWCPVSLHMWREILMIISRICRCFEHNAQSKHLAAIDFFFQLEHEQLWEKAPCIPSCMQSSLRLDKDLSFSTCNQWTTWVKGWSCTKAGGPMVRWHLQRCWDHISWDVQNLKCRTTSDRLRRAETGVQHATSATAKLSCWNGLWSRNLFLTKGFNPQMIVKSS